MFHDSYLHGVAQALSNMGIIKTANPALAAQLAAGAEPQELQAVVDAKITEKDIESAAKIIQTIAEAKQRADEMGMIPSGEMNAGGGGAGGAGGIMPQGALGGGSPQGGGGGMGGGLPPGAPTGGGMGGGMPGMGR